MRRKGCGCIQGRAEGSRAKEKKVIYLNKALDSQFQLDFLPLDLSFHERAFFEG